MMNAPSAEPPTPSCHPQPHPPIPKAHPAFCTSHDGRLVTTLNPMTIISSALPSHLFLRRPVPGQPGIRSRAPELPSVSSSIAAAAAADADVARAPAHADVDEARPFRRLAVGLRRHAPVRAQLVVPRRPHRGGWGGGGGGGFVQGSASGRRGDGYL